MATLVESADMETLGGQSNTGASLTSSSPSQHFNDSKFYLLVVIGEIVTEEHLKCAIADIEKGKMGLCERGCRPESSSTCSKQLERRRIDWKFGSIKSHNLCGGFILFFFFSFLEL